MATTTTTTSPNHTVSKSPRVVFSALAWMKSWAFVELHHQEISWMGRILIKEDDRGKYLYIEDVFLLKQECGPAETTIDATALGELITTLPPEDMNRIRFWGHSHVNMSTYWSGTDLEAMRQLRTGGINVYTVFNKKGDHLTRVDVCDGILDYYVDNVKDVSYEQPTMAAIVEEHVDAYVERFGFDANDVQALLLNFVRVSGLQRPQAKALQIDDALIAWAKQEIADKVKTKTYPAYNSGNCYGKGGSNYYGDKSKGGELVPLRNAYEGDWLDEQYLTPQERELMRQYKEADDRLFDEQERGDKGRRRKSKRYIED